MRRTIGIFLGTLALTWMVSPEASWGRQPSIRKLSKKQLQAHAKRLGLSAKPEIRRTGFDLGGGRQVLFDDLKLHRLRPDGTSKVEAIPLECDGDEYTCAPVDVRAKHLRLGRHHFIRVDVHTLDDGVGEEVRWISTVLYEVTAQDFMRQVALQRWLKRQVVDICWTPIDSYCPEELTFGTCLRSDKLKIRVEKGAKLALTHMVYQRLKPNRVNRRALKKLKEEEGEGEGGLYDLASLRASCIRRKTNKVSHYNLSDGKQTE